MGKGITGIALRWGALGAWLCAAFPGLVAAQARPTASYAVSAADDPARAMSLEPAARAWLSAHGVSAAPLQRAAPVEEPALAGPAELEVLSQVERLLREGRELSARFDERLALQRFSEAEERLRAALEIPHVHAWLAEVNLELGLCAAQLGQRGLAETALARAASLDPQRTVQAAEAPPALVLLARGIAQRRLRAPASQVLLEVEPAGASLWLDGQRVGQAPHDVTLPSGLHVLRVAAPGHRTYATLLELGPGRRAPVRVVLDMDPIERARAALLASLDEPGAALVRAHALAELSRQPVWLFEAGGGPLPRGLVYRCAPACELMDTLGEGPLLPAASLPEPGQVSAWLRARPEPTPLPAPHVERPWWKRWPAWTVGALVVVGAGVTAGVLAARDPKVVDERKLVLDPGTLPPP